MQKFRFGKSGLMITKIGFGGIPIQRVTEKAAINLIRHALDLGINWFDTANGYSDSEEKIGKAIKYSPRDKILIFTKSSAKSPEKLKQDVELSFKRLDMEYIDLYQFHNMSDLNEWETMQKNGTIDFLLNLKEKGKIKHIGASSHRLETALKLIDFPFIESIQFPFNFIVKNEGEKLLSKCIKNDIGFIGMKPFGGGMIENIKVCIRFLMQYQEVFPNPGFQNIKEIEEVITLVNENSALTNQDKEIMEILKKELGNNFCRRCGYCSPCPQGVSIVSLMGMESIIKRFPKKFILTSWPNSAAESIVRCIKCGECEKKCPYNLKIIEKIHLNADLHKNLKEN